VQTLIAHDSGQELRLAYVKLVPKLTSMEKMQVYLSKDELDALRRAAALSGRSVADLIREAIRRVVLKPEASGPVAIWEDEAKRASVEHDSVHDEP
jgi:ribbon-helix-helix CopG family protein